MLETRRRKKRAKKDFEGAAKLAKKLAKRNALPASATGKRPTAKVDQGDSATGSKRSLP